MTIFCKGAVVFSLLITIFLSATFASACDAPVLNEDTAINWSKAEFDGDDAPFKRIRREVDSLIASGEDKIKLAATYKQAAVKSPKDAQSQFRWAYAAYRASDYWRHDAKKTGLLCGVYEWMGQPQNPRSFEYARLRFFAAQIDSIWGSNRNLVRMGERLLERGSKNDFDLRYFVILDLAASTGLQDVAPLEKAFRLTMQLQKDFPKRTELYYMLGGLYGSRFAVYKKSSLADLSIRYTRKYLSMSSINDDMRKGALKRIERIERIRQRYKERGELKE